MSKFIALLLVMILHATPSLSGIVPPNPYWIGPEQSKDSNMTEKEFNSIIDKVGEIYSPVVESLGKELDMVKDWNNGTVNAYAQQAGLIWKVTMFGGLARHKAITEDGLALVVCHEMGHHLGGAPKYTTRSSWASTEGQSDYFGNAKCIRKYMEKDNNIDIVAGMDIPEYATQKCKEMFEHADDVALCQRSAMAGLSLGNLFRALRDLPDPLKFDTPDPKVVDQVYESHPAPQCRLDTYFNSALCDKDHYNDVSDDDVLLGTCNRSGDYEFGVRPLCWYKP